MNDPFHQRLALLENGSYDVIFSHTRYLLSKQTLLDGRLIKLYAYELGGIDFISLNYYRGKEKWFLKPCEMPEEKVITFIMQLEIL